ncbi:putative kinase activator [Phaeomoniella chlamydospora]|uniref:Autophagy-related protein 17 n=1 Tax=Phaeomoniella chlamydospora TaxID=158046 RepID=A0A0G2DXA9_PHACM|nr:putative kinase activator [Phaeomoniella chlamydospora]
MASSSAVSSTSSASSLHRSLQPVSHSPSPIPHTNTPSLDVLVGHLLASKRSLSAVGHLHRASTIISEARSTLERTAVTSARSAFLRRSLTSQIRILETVQSQLASLAWQGQSDFRLVVTELDEANAQLESAVNGLRNTVVDQAFRPHEQVTKTLVDFVDEKPVEEIRENLRNGIEGLDNAINVLTEENTAFENELSSIKDALANSTYGKGEDSVESFNLKNPPLTAIIHDMEDHAKEMAVSIESLVKHFDLCVTAIRHTEGGGAAAHNMITGDLPEGLDMENHVLNIPTHSISPEEHIEMLTVLNNDASEVDDVVTEVQDRISEMELQLDQILTHRDRTLRTSSAISTSFHRLEALATKLPHYTSQANRFRTTWADHEMQINDSLNSLSDLRDVYTHFISAYFGLIVEVDRRKRFNQHMNSIVREAQTQLQSLYEDDLAEREAFRHDQGDYLPSDIWPGLADPPARWVIEKVEGEENTIPGLPKDKVEDAKRRVRYFAAGGGNTATNFATRSQYSR